MKKFTVAVIVGLALVTGACSSSGSSSPKVVIVPTTTTQAPTPTTSNNYSVCSTGGSQISTLWQQYANTLQSARDAGALDSTVIAAAAATGHSLVNATHVWIANCASLFPSEASAFSSSLSTLEPLINQLG